MDYLVKFKKNLFFSDRLCIFLVNALCKFEHRKLPIKISQKLLQPVASDLVSWRRTMNILLGDKDSGEANGWGHSVSKNTISS